MNIDSYAIVTIYIHIHSQHNSSFTTERYDNKNNLKISCIYGMLFVPLFQQLKQTTT